MFNASCRCNKLFQVFIYRVNYDVCEIPIHVYIYRVNYDVCEVHIYINIQETDRIEELVRRPSRPELWAGI